MPWVLARRKRIMREVINRRLSPQALRKTSRRIRRKVLGGRVHSFMEKTQLASISVPGSSTGTGVLSYRLNDLVNNSAYKNLFDLYKLKAVKMTLVPLASQSDFGQPGGTTGQLGTLPMLYVAPNRDPYVPAPATIGDILNDDDVKIRRFTKPISFFLRSPKPALLDSAGAAVPIQMNVGRDFWLTTGGNAQSIDQSGIQHYGHRYVLTNNSPLEIVVQVYVTYYFIMKESD